MKKGEICLGVFFFCFLSWTHGSRVAGKPLADDWEMRSKFLFSGYREKRPAACHSILSLV
jgi:hypothetical protein